MTFLTRKQAAVIFTNYKSGKLNLKESAVKLLYNDCTLDKNGNAPYINGYNNNMVYELIAGFRAVLDAIFANDFEKANELAKNL